jgi:histidine triad (HIT) family protein
MSECVFCNIVAHRADSSIVYEDEVALAFMDLFPLCPGHTLVAPKAHVADLVHCPLDLAGHLFKVSALLGPAIVEVTQGAGFNVWTANGEAAGQGVFHLHLHVLPRYSKDTFGLRFPKGYPSAAPRPELEVMAAKITEMVGR